MYQSELAKFILIEDTVIRIDEVQTIEPSQRITDSVASDVYFRNGKYVTLRMSREQAMNSIFGEENVRH